MLKIVVVGPGLIGKQHIRLIGERSDATLAAIVAPDHEHNSDVARACSVPMFHSLNACLRSERVDGVIISSPNEYHAEQAGICVEADIPVLIEKPITSNVADGEALLALSERRGARVMVGHHRAHSPILSHARKIIESGKLGRLVTVMGSAQFYKPKEYFDAGPWRARKGGGPILINLIHEIGNLRALCGEILSVHAISSSAIRGYPVEDTVAIGLQFSSGALGTFMLSDTAACAKSWEQTSGENPVFPHYSDENCYVISGTMGSLSLPTFQMKFFDAGNDPSWLKPFVESQSDVMRRDPLTCQLDNFIEVIRGNAAPLVTAADGLRNLRITEAIAQSAALRQAVYV